MSTKSTFKRKIYYLLAIVLLLYPLHWLSHPSTVDTKEKKGSPGGILAQLRKKHDLSQAEIGEIDPTSVSVKLATLGLRGVAANILWTKAIDYRMKKDWANFGATLNQIIKLQPNFINVWSNQAWNLSYNISVEFDDFRERYRWVIKGLEFLEGGLKYNLKEPKLRWDMGWIISQKIGKADEKKQYRKLFKEDDDYHDRFARPTALRDNWLVGKWWYEKVIDMVDSGLIMLAKSPLIYRSSAPMCQMDYADALEEDGVFGQRAKAAWNEAAKDWRKYGEEPLPTSFRRDDEPVMIRLGDLAIEDQAARDLLARLDALQPGLREELIAKKTKEELSDAERKALDVPAEKRTAKEAQLAGEAAKKIAVTHNEVALNIRGPKRGEALDLAKQIADHEQLAVYIRRYRNIVNFDYWKKRAEIEQTDEMVHAREYIHQGDRAASEGSLEAARDHYQKAMLEWRKVFDANPELLVDQTLGEYLLEAVKRYRQILNQLDDPFPEKFILQDLLDAQRERYGASSRPN
ncbi:MAG: hypothetical protein JW959_01680 [Pirellulales bacterium]|nr:hypothetical protein [Pirellulales bacterium]